MIAMAPYPLHAPAHDDDADADIDATLHADSAGSRTDGAGDGDADEREPLRSPSAASAAPTSTASRHFASGHADSFAVAASPSASPPTHSQRLSAAAKGASGSGSGSGSGRGSGVLSGSSSALSLQQHQQLQQASQAASAAQRKLMIQASSASVRPVLATQTTAGSGSGSASAAGPAAPPGPAITHHHQTQGHVRSNSANTKVALQHSPKAQAIGAAPPVSAGFSTAAAAAPSSFTQLQSYPSVGLTGSGASITPEHSVSRRGGGGGGRARAGVNTGGGNPRETSIVLLGPASAQAPSSSQNDLLNFAALDVLGGGEYNDDDDEIGGSRLDDALASRADKELGDSSKSHMSAAGPEHAATENVRFATFDSRLKYFKYMLKISALHPRTPKLYRLYVRVSTWGCTLMCLLNIFFQTKSYRNTLFDIVLVCMHLWVSLSLERWIVFLRTSHWRDLMNLTIRRHSVLLTRQLNRGGVFGLVLVVGAVCTVVAGWIIPIWNQVATHNSMHGSSSHHHMSTGLYAFLTLHGLFMTLIIIPWGSVCISSVLLFLLIVVTHHADLMTLHSAFHAAIAASANSAAAKAEGFGTYGAATGGGVAGSLGTRAPPGAMSAGAGAATGAATGAGGVDASTIVSGAQDRAGRYATMSQTFSVHMQTATAPVAAAGGPAVSPTPAATTPTAAAATVTGTSSGVRKGGASMAPTPSMGAVQSVGTGPAVLAPHSAAVPTGVLTFLPQHYGAFIRLHAPVRKRLALSSRFFQSLVLSWLVVTNALVLSGATNLQERVRRGDGQAEWAHLVQDVFFVALGTLGLVLCFGLLAQLSRAWHSLVDKWTALPASIQTPRPEAHAALVLYLSRSETGYTILGHVMNLGHAAAFIALLAAGVAIILTLRF